MHGMNKIRKYAIEILDVLDEGVYISDKEGVTLHINRAYESITGLHHEEMVGKRVTDLRRAGKFDEILNPDIVRTRLPKSLVQLTKTGRRVVLQGHPVFDDNDDVALVVTFARDTTALSRLEEQLGLQRELIKTYQKTILSEGRSANLPLPKPQSPRMLELMAMVQNVAATDATVLLLGETGVGKNFVAKNIHRTSPRFKLPFIEVDCSAIPENLVESELFGYAPGAFSGASEQGKPGYIEMANNGTLFLNEIGELPLHVQAKLLRFLQDQEYVRVGSTEVHRVNVRVISATNKNLEEAIKEKTFREDLYYRIRVAVVNIPPLREREDDIRPLIDYFLTSFTKRYNKMVSFDEEALKTLCKYSWPGNVRELENMLHSIVATTRPDAVLVTQDLPLRVLMNRSERDGKKSLAELVAEFERVEVLRVLRQAPSLAQAAAELGIDRVTLYRKMKKYGISSLGNE